ncbi:hypothetical protein [Nonomuraea roseola]
MTSAITTPMSSTRVLVERAGEVRHDEHEDEQVVATLSVYR